MHTLSKNYAKAVLMALLSLISAIFVFICLPQITSAATGTLGDETPYVYFTYENAETGETADGNELEAGTYDVSIHLSGMANSSIVQVTGTYKTDMATVVSTPVSLLSDTVTDMESMGYILENGNIVFGFVSTNNDCSVLGDDVVIAEITVTFTEACDAEDVISVSVSPNLTFAQADYGDSYDDEYALTTEDVNYAGELYLMTCDVTPAFGYDVSGSIVVMTSPSGDTVGNPAYGDYKIEVYTDFERQHLLKTVYSEYSGEKLSNDFVIDDLLPGEYYLTVSYSYSFIRNDITLIVDSNDISDAIIPVIACDFNKDRLIDISDIKVAQVGQLNPENSMYCDLNGDGTVDISDIKIIQVCQLYEPDYSPITIN